MCIRDSLYTAGIDGGVVWLLAAEQGVQAVAAGKVDAVKAVLAEDTAGYIAAKPALAMHIEGTGTVQLIQAGTQRIQRNVQGLSLIHI